MLEIAKGTWVEAIFAKAKPEMEKPRLTLQAKDGDDLQDEDYDDAEEENDEPDADEIFNEDNITEDNYRTTFEIDTDPEEEADGISDFEPED